MTHSDDKPRVVVIDPQKLRQAGLVRLLEDWANTGGMEIVAISRPDELSMRKNCTMVLMNVGGDSVLEDEPQRWIKSIRTLIPDVPLVIFSDREERDEICAALAQGARGFIATSLDVQLAMAAMTFLSRGGSYFPRKALIESRSLPRQTGRFAVSEVAEPEVLEPEVTEHVPGAVERADGPPPKRGVGQYVFRSQPKDAAPRSGGQGGVKLTPRQSEVLERLREGLPNKVIARHLNMTEATVKVHVRQIMRKFGVANRTQAALSAVQFRVSAASR